MQITIYTLSHPITGEIRYVGRTINLLSWRKAQHNHQAKRGHTSYRNNWIRSLHKQELRPAIEALEVLYCSWEEGIKLEEYWIHQLKAWGFRLVNHQGRGDGHHGLYPHNSIASCQKSVYQYNLSGEFVAEYLSAREAAKATNSKYRMISQCCKGQENRKSTNGYMWSFIKLDRMNHVITTKGTPVYQYGKDKQFIKQWPKVERAAEALGITNSTIAAVARGAKGHRTAGGYFWSYKLLTT